MNSENHNKWRDLADRLDALESLPGEPGPDSATMWMAIEARLRAGKRKPFLWWAAALLILSGTGLVARHALLRTSVSLPGSGGIVASGEPNNGSAPAEKEHPATADSPVARGSLRPSNSRKTANQELAASLPVKYNRKTVRQVKIVRLPFFTDTARAIPGSGSGKQSMVDRGAAGMTPEPVPQVLTASAPRPLRVVHLNELEEPGFPDSRDGNAVRNDPPFHRLRLPFGAVARPASGSADTEPTLPANSFFRINLDR